MCSEFRSIQIAFLFFVDSKVRRRNIVQLRWMLLYTLHNNPSIRVYRKHYIDALENRLETKDKELNSSESENQKDKKRKYAVLKFLNETTNL